MGAKQSKRSVDISGKEAEGGGEVAAAGAGGEGRVEQLADADALKPQLNGDAHIQHEQPDKEKELDSGTPENEKDATTEKEGKEEDDKVKEQAPITNGESESKVENGDSTPTPEEGKKPKKEKVKKKWSLRSISFSRKDKPKQEKKQKEEEPKMNGEPEKVPEETAEAVPEAVANEVAEEVKAPTEEKDEKTPETPVTEPLTNGTSTGESSKAETPASEAAAASPASAELGAPVAPAVAPAPEPQSDPEQLPVNGLSLEESKPETPELDKQEESKPEPPAAETAEIVPAPEIPKEVCVEQMPLLEPTPPPLPANPPPSSVVSFAATTMAPELTDASLANTADAAIAPLTALSETKDILRPDPVAPPAVTQLPKTETPSVSKVTEEVAPEAMACESLSSDAPEDTVITENGLKLDDESAKPDVEVFVKPASDAIPELIATSEIVSEPVLTVTSAENVNETVVSESTTNPIVIETIKTETDVSETIKTIPEIAPVDILDDISAALNDSENVEAAEITKCDNESTKELPKPEVCVTEPVHEIGEIKNLETVLSEESEIKAETPTQGLVETSISETLPAPENIPESEVDISEADDSSLPPPPIQDEEDSVAILEDADDKVAESLKQIPEPITETEVTVAECNHVPSAETNGIEESSSAPGDASPAPPANGVPESPRTNGAPSPPHTPQEPLPVSDKLADLIPEVPDVPELKTETLQETVTDVAVAN